MFKKVIIGIDERDGGRDAIRLAHELVGADGSLTLVHVNVIHPIYGKGQTGVLEQSTFADAEQRLAVMSQDSGICSHQVINATSLGRGLHHLVERTGADLLVIASTRHGLIGRVLVADGTHDALNGVSCAVAIAPAGYADSPHRIREVGIAYNETGEAERALDAGREIARFAGAKLSVFEAVALPACLYYGLGLEYLDVSAEMCASVQERLSAIDDVEAHTAFGDPGEELARYSTSVDLLIVASRDFGPLGRIVHSSMSRRLAHSASCPLLILTRGSEGGPSSVRTVVGEDSLAQHVTEPTRSRATVGSA